MEDSIRFNWLFETITTHTLDIIAIVDQHRKVRFTTPMFFEIFGSSLKAIPDLDIFDVVHPEDREWLIGRHKNVIATQQKSSTEYRVIDKHGEIRHFDADTIFVVKKEKSLKRVAIKACLDEMVITKSSSPNRI